ncbi:hypothetical protein [Streptomyces iconiensis]|uniref:Uncharacterized protein n=1 Tax=Streptomyces iconiensis TaxID=1384038 RepID=A0ABT7A6I2_9ACTN|nr:hypothetical protein [Streptomyces iconiensis]MDJ1136629.1 hypothetical protein [Streptomyces iconiensis]
MTQPLDAQELLERIRRARDWADAEVSNSPAPAAESPESLTVMESIAYRAIRDTLDQILTPGTVITPPEQ